MRIARHFWHTSEIGCRVDGRRGGVIPRAPSAAGLSRRAGGRRTDSPTDNPTERNASRSPPRVYASPSSMNTVWNKNATSQATVTCRAKTAAAERPPNSERTVPMAATHGG